MSDKIDRESLKDLDSEIPNTFVESPKALLVITTDQRVIEIQVDTLAEHEIALGGMLEAIHVFETGDTLYVDLHRDIKAYQGTFKVNGLDPKMKFTRGNAILLGKDGADVKFSKIKFKAMLSFQYIA